MPFPLLFGLIPIIATAKAVATVKNTKDASDTIKAAKSHHEENLYRFEHQKSLTTSDVERLREKEIKILKSFSDFQGVFEKIHNRPEFKSYQKNYIEIPQYEGEEIKGASLAAVSVVGNLLFLGFGAPVGLILGSLLSSSLSNKADEAWSEMKCAEKEINRCCEYMQELSQVVNRFRKSLERVNMAYMNCFSRLRSIVEYERKTNWNDFNDSEKLVTENTVLLVGLLYEMCKVQLTEKSSNDKELSKIRTYDVDKAISNADEFLRDRRLAS